MVVVRILIAILLLLTSAGCRRRHSATPTPQVEQSPPPTLSIPTSTAAVDTDELQQGSLVAFGLALPALAMTRVEGDETRMYHVQAQMPRVLRYIQQRLDYTSADVQPLNAMIRSARLREGNSSTVLDVGIRDEGDRTLLTVWNRTPAPETLPRSRDDQLRAAGYDPQTQRLDPRYNR